MATFEVISAAAIGGGGGGTTIYTGDGALAGNRIVDLDGNSLSFQQGGQDILKIDPTTDDEKFLFRAFNSTDNNNISDGQFTTSNINAAFQISADFNDGVKSAFIQGSANATTSTLTYTADKHTFNGVLNLPTQAAPGTPVDGDIWREDNTNTGLKIRINGVTKTITVS